MVGSTLSRDPFQANLFCCRKRGTELKSLSLKRLLLAVSVAFGIALICSSRPAMAEEGGTGHYFPGSISDIADAVPPSPHSSSDTTRSITADRLEPTDPFLLPASPRLGLTQRPGEKASPSSGDLPWIWVSAGVMPCRLPSLSCKSACQPMLLSRFLRAVVPILTARAPVRGTAG